MRAVRLFFFFITFVQCLHGHELTPDFTIHIPMRDGMELPTDIYLPSPDAKNLPCILLRNPSGRKAQPWQQYSALSKLGYVVAIQDTRSSLDTEGKTFPYFSDGWGLQKDGYDTVEWLAKHPLTNGKIGTVGFSAAGITQLMLAGTNPPSLKCQYIGVAAGSIYHHGIFPGGQFLKNQVEGWLGKYAKDSGVLSYVWNQPFYNDFWAHFDSISVSDRVNVPAIIYGGWYDTFLQGTLDAFAARQNLGSEGARGKQKLLIGPWTHHWPYITTLGDFQVPQQGHTPPHDMSAQYWFDYYLKDIRNDAANYPAVTYYVMGPFDGTPSSGNVWRTADKWPVPSTPVSFYLSEDRRLVENEHQKKHSKLTFEYDPQNPVPTIGGRNLFLESGPKDQSPIENRPDVVVFTTEPLTEDIEVTGPLYVKLFVSSDQPDTDVVARLTDVYPDGRSILISDGIFRTGILHYHPHITAPLVNQPHEVDIDLWSTSLVFAKGHCIRLSICSSNYPRYEKNHNIGLLGMNTGIFAIAKNTIHMGDKYQSRLILPIVRRGDKWLTMENK